MATAPTVITRDTTKVGINSLRFRSRDCVDNSIKLFSNFGESIRLPRAHKDDFSWDKNGLLVVKNLSEQDCTLEIEVMGCAGEYLIMRSSHQSARLFKTSDSVTRLLKAGESLTFRSDNAVDRGFGEATNL